MLPKSYIVNFLCWFFVILVWVWTCTGRIILRIYFPKLCPFSFHRNYFLKVYIDLQCCLSIGKQLNFLKMKQEKIIEISYSSKDITWSQLPCQLLPWVILEYELATWKCSCGPFSKRWQGVSISLFFIVSCSTEMLYVFLFSISSS